MIEFKDIYKTYRMGQVEVNALSGVSLKIEAGEFVAIMGPSGSGKSTLLHILGFLDRPDSGSYLLQGRDIAGLTDNQLATLRNHLAGFVFQQFHLLSRMTALQNAELPLIYAGKRHLKDRASEKIKEVGLQQRGSHWPSELSGGEQQRVAIARALVNEPMILFADEPTGNLDTKSEGEIVAILKDLNAKGKTIIMVTHEQEVAMHAKRIIRMRDGKIISDERVQDNASSLIAGNEVASIDNILSGTQQALGKAEFIDHLRQAMHAIVFNKMRSILSMLGILIGVAAVIAMLALGQGAKDSIAQRLSSLGSNLLTIRPGSHQMHGVAMESGAVTRFTIQDAEAIARLTDEVKRVSASVTGRAQMVYADKNWNTQVQGTSADYADMHAAKPSIGRFFSDEDVRMRQKVVLLGTTVAKELFGEDNPLGASVKINRINFSVIGVLPAKGATGWHDQDDVVIIPVTTAMYRLLGKDYIDSIDVEVLNSGLMQQAQDAIRGLVIKRHRLEDEKEDSFEIRNMADIQEALESTAQTMTWLLGSIAAISLLVGGIGIMNIMLVSVTERTREIGLRKAVGARPKDILTQFLIESVVMTFLGGAIGILFGTGIAVLLSVLAGWTTHVMPASIILATTFSVFVGIGFGLWPAQKASHLNPIEALRYE